MVASCSPGGTSAGGAGGAAVHCGWVGRRADAEPQAQRPAGARGTALETAPVVLPGGRQHARLVEPLS